MTTQEITLTLPKPIYEQIKRVAEQRHRSVDDILIEAAIAIAPTLDAVTETMRSSIAQLTYLNDAALWQAARSTMQIAERTRLEELHNKGQREGLAPDEEEEAARLLTLYRETILVRAQSAAILKRRGYNVSDVQQFAPVI